MFSDTKGKKGKPKALGFFRLVKKDKKTGEERIAYAIATDKSQAIVQGEYSGEEKVLECQKV